MSCDRTIIEGGRRHGKVTDRSRPSSSRQKRAYRAQARQYEGRGFAQGIRPGFAKGRRKDMMLKTLLAETGTASLHEYLKHHHK
jgi:hypothetical protein